MSPGWLAVAVLWLIIGLTQPGNEAYAWLSIVFFVLAAIDD